MKIVFRYVYMDEVFDFAMLTLRDLSPVGSGNDPNPDFDYRDNHIGFLNGRSVKDVSAWKPGDVIHISNPAPYSRKIESGRMSMSVPGHIYERSVQIINSRFGDQARIEFTIMPVRFGDAQAAAGAIGKGRTDWLTRQPALIIRER